MRVLVTGATRGLGLAVARDLAGRGADVVVAGRDRAAVERVAASVGGAELLLDLADPGAVAAVAAGMPPLDAVVANAGVQGAGTPTRTAGGLEETLAINVLGHVALLDALRAADQPLAGVVLLGSATHDPARVTGMPAPDERADVAALVGDAAPASGPRRYATSKLHVTALTGAYARADRARHWVCFDPGLMPGTGLARDHGAVAGALWSTVMRGLTVLPFASTPARSARVVGDLLLDGTPAVTSGTIVDHHGRPGAPSVRAADPAYQDAVLAGYRALLVRR